MSISRAALFRASSVIFPAASSSSSLSWIPITRRWSHSRSDDDDPVNYAESDDRRIQNLTEQFFDTASTNHKSTRTRPWLFARQRMLKNWNTFRRTTSRERPPLRTTAATYTLADDLQEMQKAVIELKNCSSRSALAEQSAVILDLNAKLHDMDCDLDRRALLKRAWENASLHRLPCLHVAHIGLALSQLSNSLLHADAIDEWAAAMEMAIVNVQDGNSLEIYPFWSWASCLTHQYGHFRLRENVLLRMLALLEANMSGPQLLQHDHLQETIEQLADCSMRPSVRLEAIRTALVLRIHRHYSQADSKNQTIDQSRLLAQLCQLTRAQLRCEMGRSVVDTIDVMIRMISERVKISMSEIEDVTEVVLASEGAYSRCLDWDKRAKHITSMLRMYDGLPENWTHQRVDLLIELEKTYLRCGRAAKAANVLQERVRLELYDGDGGGLTSSDVWETWCNGMPADMIISAAETMSKGGFLLRAHYLFFRACHSLQQEGLDDEDDRDDLNNALLAMKQTLKKLLQ